MGEDRRLADWAVKKVEAEFSQDVCLLIEHRTLRLEEDRGEVSFSYFVPGTDRSGALARTFIIGEKGYDLFPISWARLSSMADVEEYNTTCLADGEILYARSEEDRQRFLSLQARLKANLLNPALMKARAEKWLKVATELYGEMLFEDRLCKVRERAGYIVDLLALSIALFNGRYFRHGQTDQLEAMGDAPKGFKDLYRAALREGDAALQKRLCHEMIALVRAQVTPPVSERADAQMLALWYQELRYTWRRVKRFIEKKDDVNAYVWCAMLQDEVDRMGAPSGILDTDILGAFDAGDLSKLAARLDHVENAFICAIEAGGAKVERYADIDAFLREN